MNTGIVIQVRLNAPVAPNWASRVTRWSSVKVDKRGNPTNICDGTTFTDGHCDTCDGTVMVDQAVHGTWHTTPKFR